MGLWVTAQVELPEEVISAKEEGRLVLFVGAGVSRNPPTNQPSFEELVDEIQKEMGIDFPREENEPPDQFLGRIERDHKIDVHSSSKRIIDQRGSSPNQLHRDLIRLFPKREDVRIVTTNFDNCLTVVLKDEFPDSDIYYAPALPLGDQFSGLVYLHGCVGKESSRLVLTDRDFGKAYLTEGWASQFLVQLFQSEYLVLFIGYSCKDIVFSYLARALPPVSKRKRFAFARKNHEEEAHWESHNIEVIPYPSPEGCEHEALVNAINAWGNLSKMDLFSHANRIKTMIGKPQMSDPEEESFLVQCLRDPAKARLFTEYASTPEWLKWVEEKGFLKNLFDPKRNLDEVDHVLADWFAKNFVSSRSKDGLALVGRNGLNLHLYFAGSILQHLLGSEKRESMPQWLELVMQSVSPPSFEVPDHQKGLNSLLSVLLQSIRVPGEEESAFLLFEYLTRPYIFISSWDGELEVSILGDTYFLDESWKKIFRPNIDKFALRLIPVITRNMEFATFLWQAWRGKQSAYDPIGFSRQAIEEHEQDKFKHEFKFILLVFDILIDAARDTIEFLIEHYPIIARAIIELWSSSPSTVLKRVAIYGLGKYQGLHLDQKLNWLIEKRLLSVPGTKHEIFQLFKETYGKASEETREKVLIEAEQAINSLPQDLSQETKDYELYNLLLWLLDCVPDSACTKVRLDQIKKAHPDFEPREHPDFGLYWKVGFVPDLSPKSYKELTQTSPKEILPFLLEFQEKDPLKPNRRELLNELERAVSISPQWRIDLPYELVKIEEFQTDLWERIFRGWRKANEVSAEEWGKILELLEKNPELYRHALAISYLLDFGISNSTSSIPPSLHKKALSLSEKLWKAVDGDILGCGDWVREAINHPGGVIVDFWVKLLAKELQESGERNKGLPKEYRELFGEVIGESTIRAQMGRVILLGQLNFIFSIDEDWAVEKLIPLLDWDRSQSAVQAWHGFLGYGRVNEGLFPYLIPHYEKAIEPLPREPKEFREKLIKHLAEIALMNGVDPLKQGWLKKFLLKVDSNERKGFAAHLRVALENLPEKYRIQIWSNRLKKYWDERIKGIPIKLEPDEVLEMIEWIFPLQNIATEVVQLICSSPVPSQVDLVFFHRLKKTDLPEREPDAIGDLLLQLAPCSPQLVWADMLEIVKRLIQNSAPKEKTRKICEALVNRGCTEALKIFQDSN